MTPPRIHIKALKRSDKFERFLKKSNLLAETLGIELTDTAPAAELISFRYLSLKEYLDRLQTEANDIIDETRRLKETQKSNYAICSELIGFLGFDGLGISIDELMGCKYITSRFGRIPTSHIASVESLDENYTFLFRPFDQDGDYTWCMYIASTAEIDRIDLLMCELKFEKTNFPDHITESADSSARKLLDRMENDKKRIDELEAELKQVGKREQRMLNDVYNRFIALDKAYRLREKTDLTDDSFYLAGFIPTKRVQQFQRESEMIGDVSVIVLTDTTGKVKKGELVVAKH